jgi:hypothetical protein
MRYAVHGRASVSAWYGVEGGCGTLLLSISRAMNIARVSLASFSFLFALLHSTRHLEARRPHMSEVLLHMLQISVP